MSQVDETHEAVGAAERLADFVARAAPDKDWASALLHVLGDGKVSVGMALAAGTAAAGLFRADRRADAGGGRGGDD